ncbi:MAG: hypothetical protein MZV65_25710 [Chromatiales bacterium]|nr:hypothetical protein [Chromatiales bacterium]
MDTISTPPCPRSTRRPTAVSPPFCVQPMTAVEGVETVGELEVLNYLHRMSQGDKDIPLVDSRTPGLGHARHHLPAR